MLEAQKSVLLNVSYDLNLFRKELIKSLVWLNTSELTELRKWLRDSFEEPHIEIVKEVMYPDLIAKLQA